MSGHISLIEMYNYKRTHIIVKCVMAELNFHLNIVYSVCNSTKNDDSTGK